jgi:hypothetical protein
MKVLRRTYFIYFLIPYKEVLWWDTPGWVGRVRVTVIGDTFHNKTISKRHTQIFISKQSQKDIHKYLSPSNLKKTYTNIYLQAISKRHTQIFISKQSQKDIHKYLSPSNLKKTYTNIYLQAISKKHTQIFISKQSPKDIHKYLSPSNLHP